MRIPKELIPDHDRSARSYVELTDEHLARLAVLAAKDHATFTRPLKRPEYADRQVAVVLAQGAAQHYVDCLDGVANPNGVKDLDVWTFYVAIPGERFPADRRETHADFGPSELGRQLYDLNAAKRPSQLARWKNWNRFEGRRVDFLMRQLQVDADATLDEVMNAMRAWLRAGASSQSASPPSSWYLAQKAVVLIEPVERRGEVVWRPQRR
jgi:hypothetical protein